MKTAQVELRDIVLDPILQVRDTDNHTIARYSRCVKQGDKFPPIVIDDKKRLVCGWHRYAAFKQAYKDPLKKVRKVKT